MVDSASFSDALLRDLLVQSTVIFAVGLLVARCVRLPARAHAVLLMAFLGAVATPLASGLVRYGGWGMLEAQAPTADRATRSPREQAPTETPAPVALEPSYAVASHEPADVPPVQSFEPASRPVVRDAVFPEVRTPNEPDVKTAVARFEAAPDERGHASFSAVAVFTGFWFVGSVLAVGRLLHGVWAGRRLMAAATPCRVAAVERALQAVRQRLGLDALAIQVFQSPAVRCPVIWCWGRCPRVLLPSAAAGQWSTAAWTPILCHELAHWKRRDHLSALAAEIVCCLVPWQPLAWWAKRRMEQASEQACDDWAVAAGHSATDYAETLLGLIAQPGSPLQLAALRRRSGLGSRVRHILTLGVPRPRLGRLWGVVIVAGTATIIAAAALCQRGAAQADAATVSEAGATRAKAESKDGSTPADAASTPSAASKTAKQESASDQPKRHTAAGRVMGPNGQPIAGATVLWEFRRTAKPTDWQIPPAIVAQTKTDGEGRFSLAAELVDSGHQYSGLVIRAAGYGLRTYSTPLDKLGQPLTIPLEPSYTIEGSIFTPNGEPVKGAKVLISAMRQYAPRKSGDAMDEFNEWYVTLSPEELHADKPRTYWPAPAMTDENGQFRVEDVVPRSATADLVVLAKDFAKTRIGVAQPDALHHPTDNSTWREPKFTLVLENPYVVNGRFADEKTAAGIPDVEIEVTPASNGGGWYSLDRVVAKSDQEGRYTLRVRSADFYHVKVHPPLGYAGIEDSIDDATIEKLVGKGRKVNYEVKLRRGAILRGRVIAADTGDPVPDADVVYRPERNRKLGTNRDFEPVKSAADGAFEVTAADGKGFLLVDAPDKGFYRLVVDDKRAQRYDDKTYPHGLVEIDVPADGKVEPYTIKLNRGRELVVRALDPTGKPVNKLASACVEQDMERYFSSKDARNGLFRITAAQPGRTYRVFLFSEDAMAGIVTEVEAPEDGRVIDVRLEPCATIRGRYVYEGGAPAPDVTNFSHFRIEPDKGPESDDNLFNLPFYDNFARHKMSKRVTDADGAFELNGIVPGVYMYLGLNYRFDTGKTFRDVGMLSPGEVKDLGDLVIQSR